MPVRTRPRALAARVLAAAPRRETRARLRALERLSALPAAPNADRGHLYRTLRKLEEQGLVTSEWQLPQAGAARHAYSLSADGLESLDAWAGHIRAALTRLEGFLTLHDALRTTTQTSSSHAEEEEEEEEPCSP